MSLQMFLVMLLFIEVSPSHASLLRIDCGSQTGYEATDGSYWSTDDEFVKVGNNMPISTGSFSKWTQLNTLRVFTKEKKICYKLPAQPSIRYIIRAAFDYGNYDGLSKPPTFDLEFDGNKWITVVTSTTGPQNNELIYTSGAYNIKVCLIRTSDAQFPFINVLELWPLDNDMYDGMTRDLAWLSNYRYDYGAVANTVDDWIFGYPTDSYNRIWEPTTPSDLNQTKASGTYIYDNCDNNVPDVVMSQIVEAPNLTDPISLIFSINNGINLVHYVTAYFTESHSLNKNESRSFDFYVNDKFVSTMNPRYEYCTSVWTFVQSNGTINVQLHANENSTLPPLISAIEVYTGQAIHYPKKSKWKKIGGGSGGGLLLLILFGCGCYCFCKGRSPDRKSREGGIQLAAPRPAFNRETTTHQMTTIRQEVIQVSHNHNVSIDCGSQASYKEPDRYWHADTEYTETGENKAVQVQSSLNSTRLDSLRVFTKHERNCYTLPMDTTSSSITDFTYLIRASFYYGNYDGHSDPPTFELELEGMNWATVVTSNTKPQFYELLYYTIKDNVSVCLVQSKHKQFPFINALELWPLSFLSLSSYDFVDEEKTTWLTSYRYRYGTDANDWILGYPDDEDDRIWEPNTLAGLNAVSIPSYHFCSEGNLPDSVLGRAVEAPALMNTIDLPFTFNGSHDLQHYVRAYFSSKINESETRTFDFYLNDDYISTIAIEDDFCTTAHAHVHSNGSLNVHLRPNGNSKSSPFISGIEIYTAFSGEATKEKKKKNLGLLIGLPVGLILGLGVPGLIVLLLILRSPKTRPTQGQAAATGQQQEADPQQSVSAHTPVAPSQDVEIPVSSNR